MTCSTSICWILVQVPTPRAPDVGLEARRISRWPGFVYALAWGGVALCAQVGHHFFGAEERLATEGDISSSRFAIWANTPGSRFGNFSFAWTFTPFPYRPGAFFDHTHNLPLQFAVELGLPLAMLVLALLG
jgi:hypothetical protein